MFAYSERQVSHRIMFMTDVKLDNVVTINASLGIKCSLTDDKLYLNSPLVSFGNRM